MITLKAALIAASAVGAVAAGGGATYALTGSSGDAGVQTQGVKPPAAERQVRDALPQGKQTCLPAKPGVRVPETGVKKKVDEQLQQRGAAKDLPKVDVPDAQVPDAQVPNANVPNAKVPNVEVPDVRTPDVRVPDAEGKVPGDLPTCAPGTENPKRPTAQQPGARVPAKPAVPKLDCSKLTPAVQVGGTVERTVMLTKGLRHVSTLPAADLQQKNICAVTQKWAGRTGQWVTVKTLKTPAGMTRNQLRTALGLKDGTVTTAKGVTRWVAQDRSAVLVFDSNGRSLLVNGSPVLAGGLTDVATALAAAR